MQRRLTDGEKKSISEAWALLFISGNVSSKLQGVRDILAGMIYNNTTDGLPYVEPPLTDEDARARIWVMTKGAKALDWSGPYLLIRKRAVGAAYIVEDKGGSINYYNFARRATPAEIAAAGLTTPDA